MPGVVTWRPGVQTYSFNQTFESARPMPGVTGRAAMPIFRSPGRWGYVGHVMPNVHCPVYDNPCPNGAKTGEVYVRNQCVQLLLRQ